MNYQKRNFFKRVATFLSILIFPFNFKNSSLKKDSKFVWFLNKNDK